MVSLHWLKLYIIGLCHFILRDWIHNCLFNFQYMNQLIFVANTRHGTHTLLCVYINRFLSVGWVWLLNLSLSVSIDIDNIVLDTWISRRQSFRSQNKWNYVLIPNHETINKHQIMCVLSGASPCGMWFLIRWVSHINRICHYKLCARVNQTV